MGKIIELDRIREMKAYLKLGFTVDEVISMFEILEEKKYHANDCVPTDKGWLCTPECIQNKIKKTTNKNLQSKESLVKILNIHLLTATEIAVRFQTYLKYLSIGKLIKTEEEVYYTTLLQNHLKTMNQIRRLIQ